MHKAFENKAQGCNTPLKRFAITYNSRLRGVIHAAETMYSGSMNCMEWSEEQQSWRGVYSFTPSTQTLPRDHHALKCHRRKAINRGITVLNIASVIHCIVCNTIFPSRQRNKIPNHKHTKNGRLSLYKNSSNIKIFVRFSVKYRGWNSPCVAYTFGEDINSGSFLKGLVHTPGIHWL